MKTVCVLIANFMLTIVKYGWTVFYFQEKCQISSLLVQEFLPLIAHTELLSSIFCQLGDIIQYHFDSKKKKKKKKVSVSDFVKNMMHETKSSNVIQIFEVSVTVL